jgi:hypothetical protein
MRRSTVRDPFRGFVLAVCLISGFPVMAVEPAEEVQVGPEWTDPGSVIWKRQLGTSAHDEAVGVTTDVAGNVLIVGRTNGALGGRNRGGSDAFVAKYDPWGKIVWQRQFGTSDWDWADGVATDSAGNVLIVGGDVVGDFVAKYNASGKFLWRHQFGTFYGANGVTADATGNVLVTGLKSTPEGYADAFTAKYSPSGTILWTRLFRSLDPYAANVASGVTTDTKGNILVTGTAWWYCFRCNEPKAAFVVKYSPAGKLLWTRQLNSPDFAGPSAAGVATDKHQNVLIAGYTLGSLGGPMKGWVDAFITKYDSSGKLLWMREFNPAGPDGASIVNGVVTDVDRNGLRVCPGRS